MGSAASAPRHCPTRPEISQRAWGQLGAGRVPPALSLPRKGGGDQNTAAGEGSSPRGISLSIARAKSLRHNQTGPERALWRLLWQFREDGWHFRRQQPIGPYYADFACMHAKLVIEVDGETHVSPRRDAARDEYMRGRGIHVLRFTNDDVLTNESGVYEVVAGVLGAISKVSNTLHPSPEDASSAPSEVLASPSPLRGGDRGGGTLPAQISPDGESL
jgi:very-short-patch-repair endonuclease